MEISLIIISSELLAFAGEVKSALTIKVVYYVLDFRRFLKWSSRKIADVKLRLIVTIQCELSTKVCFWSVDSVLNDVGIILKVKIPFIYSSDRSILRRGIPIACIFINIHNITYFSPEAQNFWSILELILGIVCIRKKCIRIFGHIRLKEGIITEICVIRVIIDKYWVNLKQTVWFLFVFPFIVHLCLNTI